MLCDGNPDCPDSEDENLCADFQCAGLLRCRGDGRCVHPSDICDGVVHCLHSADDEKFCDMLPCPSTCVCRGVAVQCLGQIDDIDRLSVAIGAMILQQVYVTLQTSFRNFRKMVFLKITNSGFDGNTIEPVMFATLSDLLTLIIRNSGIRSIKSESFEGMAKLQMINLHANAIHEVHPYTFTGFLSILHLSLSNLQIKHLHKLSFFGMNNLHHLDLTANQISTIQYSTYYGMQSIQTIDLRSNEIMLIDNTEFFTILPLAGVVVYLDKMLPCCSLSEMLTCFVGAMEKRTSNCGKLKKVEISYFNITFSLITVIILVVMFICQKSKSRTSSHYTILKQLCVAGVLQSCYQIASNMIFLILGNRYIYLQTKWLDSYACALLNVIFFTGFTKSKVLSFILVLDQLIEVKYVFHKHAWSDYLVRCLLTSWVVVILAAISQQLLTSNVTVSCMPLILADSNIKRLVVTGTVLFVTGCLTAAIPCMYYVIASHVKISNQKVKNKLAAANQKKIIRKGVIVSVVFSSSWLPMIILAVSSYTHPVNTHLHGILIDAVIHLSEIVLVFYFSYIFNIIF